MTRTLLYRLPLSFLVACDGGGMDVDAVPQASINAAAGDSAPCVDLTPPPPVDCDVNGNCPSISIAGDPVFRGLGFRGYADPAIVRGVLLANRMWLSYSWPHLVVGADPDGKAVILAAVENHLARSDDGGATFTFVRNLWPAVAAADPEGSGENGIFSSETASLVWMWSAGTITWYGAHLRYFLRPMTGYNPKYVTSWQVRIGAAASPAQLATAPEAILGVSTTASVYQPHVRLDELAGVLIQHCAMLNNPTLFVQGANLSLIVECLAFVGTNLDFQNSTTRVFATTPSGPPSTWPWRHAGVLADHALAVQLGADTIQQPDVSLAADGTPTLMVTPAHADATAQVGTVGDGCVAVEIESIDPPRLRRDCAGRAVIRASVTGTHVMACTHDRASATGIIATTELPDGNFLIRRTGARP